MRIARKRNFLLLYFLEFPRDRQSAEQTILIGAFGREVEKESLCEENIFSAAIGESLKSSFEGPILALNHAIALQWLSVKFCAGDKASTP